MTQDSWERLYQQVLTGMSPNRLGWKLRGRVQRGYVFPGGT